MNHKRFMVLLMGGAFFFSSHPALSDQAEIMGQIEDGLNFCEHDVRHAAHFDGTDLVIESYLFSQGNKPTRIYRIPVKSLKYAKYTGSIFFQCKDPGCVQLISPGQFFDPPTIERRTTLTVSICDIDTNEKVSTKINQLIHDLD